MRPLRVCEISSSTYEANHHRSARLPRSRWSPPDLLRETQENTVGTIGTNWLSSRLLRSMPAPFCSRSTSRVANFTVQNPVPIYFGSNQYTIDSDYGVFTADGNAMLMRRVAEIQGIAALQAMSQTSEFAQAAAQAAETPLNVAQDLVTNPLPTISSVPRGILGFLNQAGQAVKEVAEGNQPSGGPGNVVENLSGFAKTKRDSRDQARG